MPRKLTADRLFRIEARLRAHESIQTVAADEGCGIRTVRRYASNLLAFGSLSAPSTSRMGRPRAMTAAQDHALEEWLTGRPMAYQEEMIYFLWDRFDITVSQSTVKRAIERLDLTFKRLKKRASERSDELRDAWVRRLVTWEARMLVFIDESAANEHTKDRKYGYAKRGVSPIVHRSAKRTERYSVLPAYTLDGLITHHIYQGSYTAALFNWFIEQYILPHCNRFPGDRSVLIMDNASVHKSQVSIP